MGLGNLFRWQMRSILEWRDGEANTVFYRLPTATDEIKNASRLIVGPAQGCLLVYEGRILEQVGEQTLLSLKTDNHPFITTLGKFATMFESEHKLRLYFYRTTIFPALRWGTSQPVRYLDPVYRLPLAVGANGTYSLRLEDPQKAFLKLVAGESSVDISRIRVALEAFIPRFIGTSLAGAACSCNELDVHLEELGADVHARLREAAGEYGFDVPEFRINGTVFDEETKRNLNAVFSMRTRQLEAEQVHMSYEQLERLRAMREAAAGDGSLAGAAMQIGTGLELAERLLSRDSREVSRSVEQEKKKEVHTVTTGASLEELQQALEEGRISRSEYEAEKRALSGKV